MTKPVALYRLRDAQKRLLYIGITSNPDVRFHNWDRGHAANASWWREVESGQLTWYPDRPTALAAEKLAIQTEHPRCNRTHRTDPPDDWEWADWEAPINHELIEMMRNRSWGFTP